MEEWRLIEICPLYEVSTHGRIRRVVKGRGTTNGLFRQLCKTKSGHLNVTLCANGKTKTFLVHRLVAIAFIPNPYNFNEVAHNDGIPSRNYVSNLRWATRQDNSNDRYLHGTDQMGVKNISAILDESDVVDIRRRFHSKQNSAIELAQEFKINRRHIYRITNRHSWSHIA